MKPCRLLYCIVLAITLACLVTPVGAATYYVSTTGNDATGDGSAGNPWATINHADSLSLLNPGDTVIVAAGTYPQASGDGVVLQNSGGTAGAPITYLANGNVLIDQSTFLGLTYGFAVKVPYITVSGFEIKGAANGVWLTGRTAPASGNNCIVTNCVIRDAGQGTGSGAGGVVSGVFMDVCTDALVVRNVIYNIQATANTPWSPIGCGVEMSSGDNNNVWNNTIDNAYVGIYYYGSTAGGPGYGHITTRNNIVVNCNGWGFVNPWSTDPSYFTSDHNLLFNNAVTYGNYPAGNNGPFPSDVTANPMFVFVANRDYHLLTNSPAIDAGTNVGLPFLGSAPDMGAFEGGFGPSSFGTVNGKVTANIAGSPAVAGAVVETLDGSVTTTTDANGNYSLIVPSGSVTLKASGRGLSTLTNNASLPDGGTVTLNFSLDQTYVPVTYYVDNAGGNDSNPGTQAQPWKTIGNGDQLGVLNPGDTVIVQAGTYPQASTNGVFLTQNYGYVFSPITYQAQGNVVIDQSNYSGTSYGFKLAVGGIKLDGFEITGAQHGIYLSPLSGSCTVSSCVIHDAKASGQDAEGIFVDHSPNATLARNVIYNITDPGNNPWSPVGCGIRVSNGNNLVVEHNTIDNAFIGVFWYGNMLDQFGVDHGPWGHITTLNNIVVNCPGWAFVSPSIQNPNLFTSGYNLVFGNSVDYENFPGANSAPLPSDVKGLDPKFVNQAAHNYQLQINSPAIDAGTDVGLAYVGLGPDVGALESSSVNTPQTYYVDAATGNDSNPGTLSQPWLKIGNGDATGMLKPGDIVVVNSGTYAQASAGGVTLTNRSGTLLAPITYRAQGSVLIDQNTFGAGSYGFNVAVAGIVLDGFEIKGAQHGVYLSPGSHACTVNACVIHDANNGGDADGIFVNQSDNVTLTRNVIYNIHAASEAPWGPMGVGIRTWGGNSINVFNNTINNAYLGIFTVGPGGNGAGPSGLITTKNNIVVNINGWAFVNPWGVDPSKFSCSYNLVFNDVTTYGNYPAGNNGPFPSDVTGDPLFVNAAGGDFHLQAESPAINKGTDVGLPFAGSEPDMGAYESAIVVAPTLAIARSGGNVVLTWAGGGILQSSTNVVGTYTDIIGSSSPWTNAPTGVQKFYRIRQ